MLTWVEGPRQKGCTYHKKSVFRIASASGQIDVFVMPRIARGRPIAITVNVTDAKGQRATLRDALKTPSEADSLHASLTAQLVAADIQRKFASGFVADVVALIRRNEQIIRAAFEELD